MLQVDPMYALLNTYDPPQETVMLLLKQTRCVSSMELDVSLASMSCHADEDTPLFR